MLLGEADGLGDALGETEGLAVGLAAGADPGCPVGPYVGAVTVVGALTVNETVLGPRTEVPIC